MKKKLPKKKDGTEGKQVGISCPSIYEDINDYCCMNDMIVCCKQPEVTSTGVKFPENKGAGVFLRSARVSGVKTAAGSIVPCQFIRSWNV